MTNGFSLTKGETATRRAIVNNVEIKSCFNFLKSHNGLRPGKLHLAIGTTGSGKSTLVRALVLDILKNNPEQSLVLYLSEENEEDLRDEFSQANVTFEKPVNLFVLSEDQHANASASDLLNLIENKVKTSKATVLIFDNITTSLAYNDQSPSDQFKFISKIKTLTKKLNIATLLIAHTNSQTSDNSNQLIKETDIRGSKSIVNLVEFLYIIQRFQIKEFYFTAIRIIKHRGQNITASVFRLVYQKAIRSFENDKEINFETFKEAFRERNHL